MTTEVAGAGAGNAGAESGGSTGATAAASGAGTGSGAAATAEAAGAASGQGGAGSDTAAGAGAGGSGATDQANSGEAGTGAGGAAGDGKSAGGDQTSAGAKWEANWRESYAGKDEKKLNVLKRYNSPKDALDALFSARQKIDAGEAKAPLPENATPEQLAEYRKSNGIPEKPEAYLESLPKDVHLEDGDKEVLAPYLTAMHELNMTPAQASKLIALRQAEANRQIDERLAADEQLRTRTEDELRQEWGPQYRATVNNINGFLKHHFGEEGAEAILQARTPDGSPLVGSPEVLRSLGQLAAMIKGAPTTIVGGDGGLIDQKGVEGRIGEIEKMMGNQSSDYWKGPKSESIQAEYRKLIDARDEMKRRAA